MSFKNERFLVKAIEECQLNKIINCFKHGHNLNTTNDQGQNLLMYLLKQQHKHQDDQLRKRRFEIFRFLLVEVNLSLEHFDNLGKNIFNWACNLNCVDEALYLLRSYPGDLEILRRDHFGSCSLHYAIEHGNEFLVRAIVNYLLQYRLRFDIRDAFGNLPDELAEKLGYHEIAEYLSDNIRSTIHVCREIDSRRFPRPLTNKTKYTVATKTTFVSLSSLSSASSFSSPSFMTFGINPNDFYSIIESKINKAKQYNDWKTVAALRNYQAHPEGRKVHQLPTPRPHVQIYDSSRSSTLKLPPIRVERDSIDECQQLLHRIEPQLTPSYRPGFIPYYERPVIRNAGGGHGSISNRKVSQPSSRRQSALAGARRRESNVSQLGDGVNRLLIPTNQKQQRQSVAPPRLA